MVTEETTKEGQPKTKTPHTEMDKSRFSTALTIEKATDASVTPIFPVFFSVNQWYRLLDGREHCLDTYIVIEDFFLLDCSYRDFLDLERIRILGRPKK